jgi:mannose-1-phosphate guanylyltransferase
MITVIFCGGSGTRLWPLSTHHNPKQLINLVGELSPLLTTYERASKISDTVYLLPETRLIDSILKQLPELGEEGVIVEPGMRGTASCLVAALDTISRRHDKDEPIAFLSVDHHIRDTQGFIDSFEVAAETTAKEKRIVLVGIEPTSPATGFGYIEKSELLKGNDRVYEVAGFKEKPDFETAMQYTASGRYLWNCGYFVASVNTFVKEMRANAPTLAAYYDKLQSIEDQKSKDYVDTYLAFKNESIDYALIEKVDDLLVVPASFDWMDIGSFKDLHAANISDYAGNHVTGENIYAPGVENAYIRNEENKPIAVIGLDNVVVVNTRDGILVSRKDLSQRVGEIAKKIQAK